MGWKVRWKYNLIIIKNSLCNKSFKNESEMKTLTH
jgi:hypothetical protein